MAKNNNNNNNSKANTPLITNTSSSASSSSSKHARSSNGGTLKVAILSAYDLPYREPPSYVQISVNDESSITGPPSQRHKDRNSFKFTPNASGSSKASTTNASVDSESSTTSQQGGGNKPKKGKGSKVVLRAPLPDLYQSHVTIQVVYQGKPNQTMEATYRLDQCKIHETNWLVVNLKNSQSDPESTPVDDDDDKQEDDDDDDMTVPPTLRLHLTLAGPYRTEIAAFVKLAHGWFGVVDAAEGRVLQVTNQLPRIDPRYVLIPAVPLVATGVVCSPIFIGIGLVGLPMFLPFFVMAGIVLAGMAAVTLTLYTSTSAGRMQVGQLLSPLIHTILSTPSGQVLVYQTGPRPTPVSVMRFILPKGLFGRLVASLTIDAIGSSSYLLPFVGELFDIGWAPIQTILIMALYDNVSSKLKYLSFVEEILPFTDLVPSATLGWLLQFGLPMIMGSGKPVEAENNGKLTVKTPFSTSKEGA